MLLGSSTGDNFWSPCLLVLSCRCFVCHCSVLVGYDCDCFLILLFVVVVTTVVGLAGVIIVDVVVLIVVVVV